MEVLAAAGAPVEWERMPGGEAAFRRLGTPMPDATLDSIRRNRVALKGPLGTAKGSGYRSANVALRQALQLFAGWRPVRSLPGVETPWTGVDLVVVRENTEGLYAGIEHRVTPDTVVSLKLSSSGAAERIARWAFEHARVAGRRRVTVVHKRNVLPLGDGAFVDAAARVARDYPFVAFDDALLDDVALGLAVDPSAWDILLMENLYGDILSDLAAGLVGGLGVVPGANVSDHLAVFEAVHGTAPDIAGQGVANPLALLSSAVLMLRWMGMRSPAEAVDQAIGEVLSAGPVRTRDLGGTAGTADLVAALVDALPRRAR